MSTHKEEENVPTANNLQIVSKSLNQNSKALKATEIATSKMLTVELIKPKSFFKDIIPSASRRNLSLK